MITTVDTKRDQLLNGYFQSGNGAEKILLVGSCRVNSYLNYLSRWNQSHGEPFTIYHIDPCNWNWNAEGQLVDSESAILACESDERILSVLRNATVYIHEHFAYYGLFNSAKDAAKKIYDFGLNPKLDICIPNYHDRFVLFQELVNVDHAVREAIKYDGGSPSMSTLMVMRRMGLDALEKFYSICRLSSFPEMAEHFADNWTKTRFFWTGNHVSKFFTLYIFKQMNDRFLKLNLDAAFWAGAETEDLFAKPCTPVTQFDRDAYGITWDDPTEPLRIP